MRKIEADSLKVPPSYEEPKKKAKDIAFVAGYRSATYNCERKEPAMLLARAPIDCSDGFGVCYDRFSGLLYSGAGARATVRPST